jgi:hypothetical protein
MALWKRDVSLYCSHGPRCESNLGQITTIHLSPIRSLPTAPLSGLRAESCLLTSSDCTGSQEHLSRRTSLLSLATSSTLLGSSLYLPSASQASALGDSLKGLLLKAQVEAEKILVTSCLCILEHGYILHFSFQFQNHCLLILHGSQIISASNTSLLYRDKMAGLRCWLLS